MEELCVSILAGIRTPVPNDKILCCQKIEPEIIEIGGVIDESERLLAFADDRLHIFPYKDVLPCWFRLYTDASIVRAIAKVRELQARQAQQSTRNHNEELQLLDQAINFLDRSLIVAGGAGRKTEIQDLFRALPILSRIIDEHKTANEVEIFDKSKPRKRLKSRQGSRAHPVEGNDDELSLQTHSVPTINNGISRVSQPSMELFNDHMYEQNSPVIITNAMNHWEGLQSWTRKSYWFEKTLDGRRRIPIEVGRSYTDQDWGQKIVPFRYFLEHYIYHPDHSEGPGPAPLNECTRETPPSSDDDRKTGYLAQHDIFEQIPALYGSIATPEYCFWIPPLAEEGTPVALAKKRQEDHQLKTSHPSTLPIVHTSPKRPDSSPSSCKMEYEKEDADSTEVHRNIWFGPAWTISPLHHDPYHNILCQVVGKKYFRLYSPAYSDKLYPRPTNEEAPHASAKSEGATIDMSNTSTIDIAAMEISPAEDWDDTYPGISAVPYVECVLEAGEMLYIPVGWWHYVRSCSVGISVSYWWGG